MFRNLGIASLALIVSGCLAQSQIQAKYIKVQNACREESSRIAGKTNDQTALGTAFSQCMNKAGWHVASPKTGVASNNPPSGSPSTNPSAATAVAANPPSGAPSVKPSAAAASVPAPTPVAEPTATYQPARPVTNTSPAYGAGAGRNF